VASIAYAGYRVKRQSGARWNCKRAVARRERENEKDIFRRDRIGVRHHASDGGRPDFEQGCFARRNFREHDLDGQKEHQDGSQEYQEKHEDRVGQQDRDAQQVTASDTNITRNSSPPVPLVGPAGFFVLRGEWGFSRAATNGRNWQSRSKTKTPRSASATNSVIRMASRLNTNSASLVGCVQRRSHTTLGADRLLWRARRSRSPWSR
jgi:hypothetical protein